MFNLSSYLPEFIIRYRKCINTVNVSDMALGRSSIEHGVQDHFSIW